MEPHELFWLTLGLTPPWEVEGLNFNATEKRLVIRIDFPSKNQFPCPTCAVAGCGAYDTKPMRWRHLNFFQHEVYLEARVPRVTCKSCGVHQVEVLWSRPGSGFTMLFEALILMLAREMPVKAVTDLVGEHDTRLRRVISRHVDQAPASADFSSVQEIGMDETASRRGHRYATTFTDLATHRILFATPGKGDETVQHFTADFRAHGGNPGEIHEACINRSPAFISGVEAHLPNASITLNKFHVMQILGRAVVEVRRREQPEREELKKSLYPWLRNPENLKESQRERMEELQMRKRNLKTTRAYQIRLNFQKFWRQPPDRAAAYFRIWYSWARRCRLEPIVQADQTLIRHQDGILRRFESRINNGIMERINSLIQAAKTKARGYRTSRNLITMIYMISGKLEFALPT